MRKKIATLLLLSAIVASAAGINVDALEKVPDKAMVCLTCHGRQGRSDNPTWPNLAGQHRRYLIKQLHDFKTISLRQNPIMTAIVANLSDEDIIKIADFYANQSIVRDKTLKNYSNLGQQLYHNGDFKKHITACIACHGPLGDGNEQAGFPVVAGQHALYTIEQLQAFKNKIRQNDFNGIMYDISKRMNDNDIKAVAYYLQSLH